MTCEMILLVGNQQLIDYLIGLAASPCYCKGMLADQKALIHNSKELAVKYVEKMHLCGILAPKVYLNLIMT